MTLAIHTKIPAGFAARDERARSLGPPAGRMPPLVSSVSPRLSPATPGVPRELSEREFQLFRTLVATHSGIALGPHKRALLQARLGRRLRTLGLATFADYHRLLIEGDPQGEELVRFINAVTTNKTHFYREAHHFAYLAERWAPAVVGRASRGGERAVRIWSAGCSTGEEPYTIAMTLADALPHAGGWSVRILASDIDTDVLKRAAAGIYSIDAAGAIPPAALKRHFLRGTGTTGRGLMRVRPALQSLVTFRRINLLEAPWPVGASFDVIFCRNVLIYFDRPTQQRVLERLGGCLKDDGVLVLGHSEGILGMMNGLRHVGHTIYHKEPGDARDHPRR
jgi:chemotaxis protein methyltransferase CheR